MAATTVTPRPASVPAPQPAAPTYAVAVDHIAPARSTSQCYVARVVATRQLGPTLRRITVAGPDLAAYAPLGPDEYVGLLIPPPGQEVRLVPAGGDPRAAVAAMSGDVRPHLRWYTVRQHRPQRVEVDIDMVTHGDNGRASAWAEQAQVGDPVGSYEGAPLYAPPPDAREVLLVADETALPALGAIVASQVDRAVRAFVEVPHAADAQDLGAEATVSWVVRGGAAPGRSVLAAVRAAELAPPAYAWVCGEARMVAAVRRHLLHDLGVHRTRITYSGYWRLGRARP